MAKFGIPYMGSKDKVAHSIALNFPKADHFYDLFGGGFSMTHYMLVNRSKHYKHFHFNEIEPSTVQLIKDAIAGKYNYKVFKPEFVTREMFFKRIKEAYIRICWSFGNDQKTYMFSKDIEPYKHSMHNAVVFNKFNELATKTLGFDSWPKNVNTIYKKRLYLGQKIEWYRVKNRLPKCLHKFLPVKQQETLNRLRQLPQLEQLRGLQQLQQVERLQQLQQLERLERLPYNLTMTSLDYRQVEIKPNSIVYCDIPYENTGSYLGSFNHKDFHNWAASRDFPVYISEYKIKDPRFKLIYTIDKRGIFSGRANNLCQEKLYWNGVHAKLN